MRALDGYGSGVHYSVHNSSVNNLVRGVAERVLYVSVAGDLQPCRKPKANVFTRLVGLRDRLVKNLRRTAVVPRELYPGLYSGRKQTIYTRAYESLLVKGISPRDAYVSTFVKAEKVNFSAKGDPAPRVIQPRSPRYNLEVGRYLKNFEKALSEGFKKCFGYLVILKGCNADESAAVLHDNWQSFNDPVAIGLDASRFDQHVSKEALLFEHSVYNRVFQSPELARLLSWQLKNHGFGRIGESLVEYKVDGCRMSGDINTGMGNCLLMSILVLNYFEEVGLRARLSNNGDDCVVICERADQHKLAQIGDYFTDFGFNLKEEPAVSIFERIEFCQTQPVRVGTGYRMVRNPWTAMSKDCVSLLSWNTQHDFEVWRDAIGTCGKELTSGVPVWQSFYDSIIGAGNLKGGLAHVYDCGMGFMARGVKACDITEESRYSFYLAFGIDPDLQVAMENSWPGIEQWSGPLKNFAPFDNTSNPLKWLNEHKTNL